MILWSYWWDVANDEGYMNKASVPVSEKWRAFLPLGSNLLCFILSHLNFCTFSVFKPNELIK